MTGGQSRCLILVAMLTLKLTESQDYESYLLLVVDSDQRWRLGIVLALALVI